MNKTKIVKKIVGECKTQAYRYNPASSYNKMDSNDIADFAPILDVWRPNNGPDGVLLRWQMTLWCNYGCHYCSQDHKRAASTHAFDNHDVSEWIDHLERHFKDKRVSLVLTGGETMIDIKNMNVLLSVLSKEDWIDNIRIDTNISWNPDSFKDIDLTKIWLMCTFHPSQVEEEKFVEKVKQLLSLGWQIGMVNYVMSDDQLHKFEERWKLFASLGVPLHPNPLWGSNGSFSEKSLDILKNYIDSVDFQYRGGLTTPYNEKCFFPSVAYEMFQNGKLHIGCHPYFSGSLFKPIIPELPKGVMKCPYKSCMCLDKYSFLKGINRNTSLNPFEKYHDLLMQRCEK